MKKITILIVLALLCLFFRAIAQTRKPGDPLKVGDTIPDLIIQNIINYKTKSIRLSDFKDKLLLLDFWSTSCVPCIKHLPVLDSLQKEFAGKVFFLPVNSSPKFDPSDKVIAFFKKRKRAFDLPSVVADTVLKNLFQPPFLGVYVWIKNGIIQQITEGDMVNAPNIIKALDGGNINMRQMVRVNQDDAAPIFDSQNDLMVQSKSYMKSTVFPFSPNLHAYIWDSDSTGKINRVFFTNLSVLNFLMITNPAFTHFGQRIKIFSKHPEKIPLSFKTDSAYRANSYCYEGIFPPVTRRKAIEYIRQDLERCFPFTVDSMKVTDSCWVLRLSMTKKLKAGDPKNTGTNIEENLGLPVYFYNRAISSLAETLEFDNKIPVIDETGYDANVWLDLPPDLRNLNKIAKSLHRQGIVMTKEIRAVEYLVIKDIN